MVAGPIAGGLRYGRVLAVVCAALVSLPAWFPLNPRAVAKFGGMEKRSTAWTRAGNLVGNGPFILTEWTPNVRILVEKNPHHWDAARSQFVCPCHNSLFAIDGKVIYGPAPRPLDRYETKLEGRKLLLGDLRRPEGTGV